MKRLFSAKSFVAAAVALGAVAAASAAHARSDVVLSIGVQAPIYAQPAPVYEQPQVVYTQPQRIYMTPQPVYEAPAPVYYGQQPAYVEYDRGWGHQRWHHDRRYGPYGDYDRDGVPNRFDRYPANPFHH